ncbi:GatB/YqeY domain-containing protein [Phormidium tenue FACHB-886]|nr:GatB/YqeY domain-containing protein [Phormidium tenue FACHB-886]
MSQNNEGVVVSGGTFNAGQVTVGKGAQAIQTTYNLANEFQSEGKEDLAKAITELLTSLESHRPQIADYDEVSQAVQQIAEEVKKEQPSKLTLKGLLNAVKESVSSVVEIVEKIGLLQKAIAVVTGISLL